MLMNRRTFAAATGLSVALPSSAQFRVDISGVGATQVPIAIVRFKDEDKVKQAMSAIVRADLERSGVFRGVDNAAQMDETTTPSMPEWRAKSADLLVGGSVTRLGRSPMPRGRSNWIPTVASWVASIAPRSRSMPHQPRLPLNWLLWPRPLLHHGLRALQLCTRATWPGVILRPLKRLVQSRWVA